MRFSFASAKKQNIFDKTGDLQGKVVFLQGLKAVLYQERWPNTMSWEGKVKKLR
jgi:hypothetical protein